MANKLKTFTKLFLRLDQLWSRYTWWVLGIAIAVSALSNTGFTVVIAAAALIAAAGSVIGCMWLLRTKMPHRKY